MYIEAGEEIICWRFVSIENNVGPSDFVYINPEECRKPEFNLHRCMLGVGKIGVSFIPTDCMLRDGPDLAFKSLCILTEKAECLLWPSVNKSEITRGFDK